MKRKHRRRPGRMVFKKDPMHMAATELASSSDCLLCKVRGKRTHGCVPAHFPKHRGMGCAMKDPWHPRRWIPLCFDCHEWVDARAGGVSDAAFAKRDEDRELLRPEADAWWNRVCSDEEV